MIAVQHRTSFALDEPTIRKMRRLAGRWRVSQAEVLRRAIDLAEAKDAQESAARIERLRGYHLRGGLNVGAAASYLGEVAESRADWGRGDPGSGDAVRHAPGCGHTGSGDTGNAE